MDWILHIDTDELVYPGGGPEYSIQRVLASVPADVDTIVFPNYESLPERDDVQDPFTEVRRPHVSVPLLTCHRRAGHSSLRGLKSRVICEDWD